MVLGSRILIPTGMFSVELVAASRKRLTTHHCSACLREGHDPDAKHCKDCGEAP